MSLITAKPKDKPPFLRLPTELRLEIYRMLLTGRSIHMEGVESPKQNKSHVNRELSMVYNICNANDAMQSLARLDGAGHSQHQSSATSHGTRIPCLSNHIYGKGPCSSPVGLDIQLLRVCRQIYDEAMLLPYAENHFIISTGFWSAFRAEFVAHFSREKRSAMSTVAVLGNLEEEIECVADLLPGLKRLWFDIDFGCYHLGLTLAAGQSKRVKAYSQIELPRLVGVTVRFTESNSRNEGMEERMELALLGKQASWMGKLLGLYRIRQHSEREIKFQLEVELWQV